MVYEIGKKCLGWGRGGDQHCCLDLTRTQSQNVHSDSVICSLTDRLRRGMSLLRHGLWR
jgi:hypothetical protein